MSDCDCQLDPHLIPDENGLFVCRNCRRSYSSNIVEAPEQLGVMDDIENLKQDDGSGN